MKALSYIVASILMLVITIALSGTAYMYISGIFTTTIQGIEVADAYCSLGEVTLSIKNIGSTSIGAMEVEQTNPKVDDILARAFQGLIEPGKIVRYTDTCEGEESRRCIYRLTPPVGRTITADVICSGRPPSLVAAWHFDEGSGTEAKDSSGNGNDGTLYDGTTVCSDPPTPGCPKWVDGKYGKGLEFDGADDFVRAPISLISQEMTAEAWIKVTSVPQASKAGIVVGLGYALHMWVNADGTFNFGAWTTDENEEETSTQAFSFGVWRHVAVVNEGATSTKLYVDGSLIDTFTLDGDLMDITLFDIGRHFNVDNNHFHGIIDEVKIYNKALA